MEETQRQLTRTVADANQEIAPAAIDRFGQQHLALDEAAIADDQRADVHALGAILIAQRQQEQQVLDPLEPESFERRCKCRPDALEFRERCVQRCLIIAFRGHSSISHRDER